MDCHNRCKSSLLSLEMDCHSYYRSQKSKQMVPGWVEVQWSKPTGDGLEKVVERLKEHKLTIRNVPMDAAPVDGACIFTGEPAVERVLLAKAY